MRSHQEILDRGPETYQEALFIQAEFLQCANRATLAENTNEQAEYLDRMRKAQVWLPAWIWFRKQETRRLERCAPPVVIKIDPNEIPGLRSYMENYQSVVIPAGSIDPEMLDRMKLVPGVVKRESEERDGKA